MFFHFFKASLIKLKLSHKFVLLKYLRKEAMLKYILSYKYEKGNLTGSPQ